MGGFARIWIEPAIVSAKPVTTWISEDICNTFRSLSLWRLTQERTDLQRVVELEISDIHCRGTLTVHQAKTALLRRNACPTMPTIIWQGQLLTVRADCKRRAYTDASNISIRLETYGTITPGVAAPMFARIKKRDTISRKIGRYCTMMRVFQ
jgi:hypothetical protein